MMANILVLGAGYAGMMTATTLERNNEAFTLLNNHPYHYFTTLLHEAAGGRREPMDYTVRITDLLRKSTSKFVQDEVVSIDREKRVVRCKSGDQSYDYLIVTIGWIPEYFGIPGMKENSLVLRNIDTAMEIRSHIEREFREYLKDNDERHLRIVVGGAGLTGIELVGELLDWIPKLCAQYDIPQSQVDLQNIEAMPSILPVVSEQLREVAARQLTEKGARLRTNTKLVSVDPGVVHLDGDETVEAGTIIWTGGVRANPVLTDAGFTVDRRGRAKVNEFLQSVDDSHVFIGGDCAWFEEDGRPLPPTAQFATQMGPVLANNVTSLIHGQPMQPFQGHNLGTLASLGSELGVGNMMGVPVQGVIGGLAKEVSKIKYLWQLGGVRLAVDKTAEVVHL
ncbi:NAD(P)/FAD-dependent oxidoreductase [Alicyclobacillus mengziensis]|uniref:NAD(P)/FAD-dependent oxidoreductase n=1 Tax=Alicyclobacillus mengziensis TaxID=2931921 RepID=A0A9X7Z698_9BACL|nr:NAD(P)/FAD-dependent oxidoreductase [Alicyclobacillus mengziensis]QSO46126.1 NAD(P)/FAD-dependent oxidoreductase [Alicyclobacillus mengziensis]